MLCGYFNPIYRMVDKSNSNLNRCLMGRFCRLLQDLDLIELHLQGRLYTWSNERAHPTLEHIDRAFACAHWCDMHPFHRLRALFSSCSNHAPLVIHTNVNSSVKRRFRFESIWAKFLGYLQAVEEGWNSQVHIGPILIS
jgi:hypothetical protein